MQNKLMTPEEVEARFQRIEAILAQAAEYSRITPTENAKYSYRLALENTERDRREESCKEQMELMRIGIDALVESSIEYKRWKVGADQRFDLLLQEIRATNQRVPVIKN